MHVVRGHARRRVSHWVSHAKLLNSMSRYEVFDVIEVLRTQIVVVGAFKQKLALENLVLRPKLVNDTHETLSETHQVVYFLGILFGDIYWKGAFVGDVPLMEGLFPYDQSQYFLNFNPSFVHLLAS